MRILHVIRGLTNSSGVTHVVIPLSEEQARMGHQVSVFHIEKSREESLKPSPDLVDSICFPMTVKSVHFGFSVQYARELSRRIGEYDVVHIHAVWNFPTAWALRCAQRRGVPQLVSPQGSLDLQAWRIGSFARRAYARAVEIPLLRRATAFQALSPVEEAQIQSFGISAPCVVIPNGIRLEDFPPAPERAPAAGRTILFLGRIHPKKGLDILISALGLLPPDYSLVIAGDDFGSGCRRTLELQIGNAGLKSRVRWLGEVKGAAKIAALHDCDIFVLPSLSEGMPVAVLEAMAVGCPVVITPACNLPQVSVHDAGRVANPEPKSFADAILSLCEDRKNIRVCGRNARDMVGRLFAWPAIAAECINAYQRIARS